MAVSAVEKSACGKLVSSNGARQAPAKGAENLKFDLEWMEHEGFVWMCVYERSWESADPFRGHQAWGMVVWSLPLLCSPPPADLK